MFKKILIGIGVVAFLIIALGTASYFWMYTPTKGPKIEKYQIPQSALLVVDVQEDVTGPATKMYSSSQSEHLLTRVNQLIESADAYEMPVVYIGQEFADNFINRALLGKTLIEGQAGTKLDARLEKVNSIYFPKRRSDAFSNPALSRYLVENQVAKLYIIGADAAFCVYRTAQGGVNRGYDVTIISDATITWTKKTSDDILKMYKNDQISKLNRDEFLLMLDKTGSK